MQKRTRKQIGNLNDGKPSGAQTFRRKREETKGLVGRLNGIELYTIK